MKTVRAAAAAVSAAALMSTCCVPVFASSPEFARTAEEWAALKDNKLEYREIGGLVEEYNPTVQQNQFSNRKFSSGSSLLHSSQLSFTLLHETIAKNTSNSTYSQTNPKISFLEHRIHPP